MRATTSRLSPYVPKRDYSYTKAAMTWPRMFSLAAAMSQLTAAQQTNYSQFVNPFIGAEGDIFVGGAVPFGVVKMGIDTWCA